LCDDLLDLEAQKRAWNALLGCHSVEHDLEKRFDVFTLAHASL
jgi:hypothetical protein